MVLSRIQGICPTPPTSRLGKKLPDTSSLYSSRNVEDAEAAHLEVKDYGYSGLLWKAIEGTK
jgi:hypothetical protein